MAVPIAIGIGFVLYRLNSVLDGLAAKDIALFVVHVLSVALFFYVFRTRCKKKRLARDINTDCDRNAMQATLIYIFATGVIIVFAKGGF